MSDAYPASGDEPFGSTEDDDFVLRIQHAEFVGGGSLVAEKVTAATGFVASVAAEAATVAGEQRVEALLLGVVPLTSQREDDERIMPPQSA